MQTRLIRELEKGGAQTVYEPVDKWQEVIPGNKDSNLLVSPSRIPHSNNGLVLKSRCSLQRPISILVFFPLFLPTFLYMPVYSD